MNTHLWRVVAILMLSITASTAIIQPAFASGAPDQPVEWDTSTTDGVSLVYEGLTWGCKKGKWWNPDHKFKIQNPPSGPYDPEWYRITSASSTIQNIFANKPPNERSVMGYDLSATGTAYICVGVEDTDAAGGPESIARDLKIWFNTPSQPQQVVVDELSSAFTKGGAYWWDDWSLGNNAHMYWTCVNGDVVDSWGEWHPNLSATGSYEVLAFIPNYHTNTNNARYEIHYQGGMTTVSRAQSSYYDQWVSLGVFTFDAGTSGYVRLTDATSEPASCGTQIGFDAIAWVPR